MSETRDGPLAGPDWEQVFRDFHHGSVQEQDAAAEMMATYLLSVLAHLGAYRYASDWSDTCHDILLRLWRKGDEIRSPRALGGWLRTAATNAFYDWCRRPANRQKLMDSDDPDVSLLEAVASESASALEELAWRRDLEALKQALCWLTPEHREVIELLFFRGMSRPEAAAQLGLKLPGLKHRRATALRELKRLLMAPQAAESGGTSSC